MGGAIVSAGKSIQEIMKPRHPSTTSPTSRTPRISAPRKSASVRTNKGIKVEIATTINRTPEELFAFWRNFENLPQVMDHIASVEFLTDKRSRWRVHGPIDTVLEWEAEIINEHPNALIAWGSVEGSELRHAGSIRFEPGPGGLGTEVKLAVEYEAGRLADTMAKLFRHSPAQQMREDLRHFKQWMEAGEIPTTKGQPAGRDEDKSNKYTEAK
jgi:uncharacterized membrane protein